MSTAPVQPQPAMSRLPGDAQLHGWCQSGIATSEQLPDFSCAWARKYLKRMVEGPIYLDELISALSEPMHKQSEVIRLDPTGLLWRKGQVAIYGSEVIIIRVEKGVTNSGDGIRRTSFILALKTGVLTDGLILATRTPIHGRPRLRA